MNFLLSASPAQAAQQALESHQDSLILVGVKPWCMEVVYSTLKEIAIDNAIPTYQYGEGSSII